MVVVFSFLYSRENVYVAMVVVMCDGELVPYSHMAPVTPEALIGGISVQVRNFIVKRK